MEKMLGKSRHKCYTLGTLKKGSASSYRAKRDHKRGYISTEVWHA